MALQVKMFYVLKIMVADDTQGRKLRAHSIGLKRDSAVPESENTWSEILADANAYLAEFNKMVDGVVVGWSISRRAVWTGAISAPLSSDGERKGVIPIVDDAGRKGVLELPSLDESVVLSSGVGAGLYIDPDNDDVIAYLALITNGTYLFPRDGVAIDAAAAGKKMHVTSGILRERVG